VKVRAFVRRVVTGGFWCIIGAIAAVIPGGLLVKDDFTSPGFKSDPPTKADRRESAWAHAQEAFELCAFSVLAVFYFPWRDNLLTYSDSQKYIAVRSLWSVPLDI